MFRHVRELLLNLLLLLSAMLASLTGLGGGERPARLQQIEACAEQSVVAINGVAEALPALVRGNVLRAGGWFAKAEPLRVVAPLADARALIRGERRAE